MYALSQGHVRLQRHAHLSERYKENIEKLQGWS